MSGERSVSEEEREELQKAAQDAMEVLGGGREDPGSIVAALEAHLLSHRLVKKEKDEMAFQFGALFAACLEMGLGWELIEVTWEGGLVALAVVEMDRSLAILPFLAVDQVLSSSSTPATLASTFARLEGGERPPGLSRGQLAVLLPR